jgi:hypothetical protein
MLFEASRGEARTRRPAVFPAGTAVAYTQQLGRAMGTATAPTARTTDAFEGAGA